MVYDAARALELLRTGCGTSEAEFRPGQEEAIRTLIEEGGRLLLVQKTGWGKSFVYFIATRLLRDQGRGPAILISPLLALMRNQVRAAEQMGVRARTIHSGNRDEWGKITEAIHRDEVDILLISPERLANSRFLDEVMDPIAEQVSLLVVDEAHCISDWGHDFRPHYTRIQRTVQDLPANLRLLATTATANDRVMEDLRQVLGPDLEVMRGDLARPSLFLQTIRLPNQAERLAWLAENLPTIAGSGIIYTLTKRDAQQVSEWLNQRGMAVMPYSGDSDDRPTLEQALLDNSVKALVATAALSMGFDKPDLAFVIHYQAPTSVVHYYQQVGRAGRALDAAYGVLLSGPEELEIADFFIGSAFPSPHEARQVLETLEKASGGLSVLEILKEVNLSQGRVEKTLELLALESPSPVRKEGSRWHLTAAALEDEFWKRVERLTGRREDELAAMQEYVDLEDGHMDFLIRALDGETGYGAGADLPPLPTEPDEELVREAVAFLQRTDLPIEPRKRWPSYGLPTLGVQGMIHNKFRAQPGKALCIWQDAGWGRLVARGKYERNCFPEDLVDACMDLLTRWDPDPAPAWVTCIPSLRHPDLVPDFARKLASRLGLPFLAALAKTEERPEQKHQANSYQQARNVDGSLEVCLSDEDLPSGPVLLVDDMVDSRWTLTVATWLLRSAGTGEVLPLALAKTGGNG